MSLLSGHFPRCLVVLLVYALLTPLLAQAAPRALTPEQVHARIQHIGVGNLVGLQLMNGSAYAGRIVRIDEQSFALERYGEEQATTLNYSDVIYLQLRVSVAYLARNPVSPEAVRARLLKRGLGNWVGVQLSNGVAFCGAIVRIDQDSFGLQLYGDPVVTPVDYRDVVYLQTGLTGGQKAFIIALPIAFTAAEIGAAVAFHNSMPKLPTMPTQPVFP